MSAAPASCYPLKVLGNFPRRTKRTGPKYCSLLLPWQALPSQSPLSFPPRPPRKGGMRGGCCCWELGQLLPVQTDFFSLLFGSVSCFTCFWFSSFCLWTASPRPPFQKTNKLNRQMLVFAYLLVGVIWNGVIQPLSAASLLPLLCHHCSKCKCGLKDGMSRWELSTGYCWSVTASVQQISCQMVSCCCHQSLQSRFPALLAIYFCAPAMMPVVLATCRLALP